jgi:putative DNA primase/helicase
MKVPVVNLKEKVGSQPAADARDISVNAVIPFEETLNLPGSKSRPDRLTVYRNESGDGVFAVGRWDNKTGKVVRPIVWDGKRHHFAGYTGKRPLLNLPEIIARPSANVLVVEGEKAAEMAGRYLPDGWVITTWAGGASAIKQTDWDQIKTRVVIIWPDNDAAGRKAAQEIRKEIRHAAIVNVPESWPSGWDLADHLPVDVSDDDILGMIDDALASVTAIDSVLPEDAGGKQKSRTFRALGFDRNGYYYVMPSYKGIIMRMTSKELTSAAGCLRIVNDLAEWEALFPPKRGSSGVDWNAAGSMIMDKCHDADIFDEKRVCGRGVWYDDINKSVIVNTGDMFIVDGAESDPTKHRSREIYQSCEAMLPDGFDPMDEATDAEGRLIVELCNAPRWSKDVFGDLFAGFIATAVVCGGLEWRTHIWVTGNSGSGKSTVVNDIAGACIGDIALYPLGETTEAGIRQMIGQDARPVVFDEMEGTDQSRSNSGDSRRQAIVQLMRMSSTTGRGRIIKGGSTHKATEFVMRSSFLVASIGVSLKEAPDLTRTMILSLKPLSPDASPAEKLESEERWAQMNRLSARIYSDMPRKLLARQMRLLPVLRENAKTFREVISDVLGNRRLGDQVGVLLAGRCSLTSDKVMTYDECKEYLMRFQWDGIVSTSSDREDRTLIRHLRQTVTRVIADDGRLHDRTIGELIQNVLNRLPDGDHDIGPMRANRHLMRIGIRVEGRRGVWIAKGVDEMNKIMRTSANASDWWSVISRYPDAEVRLKVSFAGISAMAIKIPEEEWID